MNKQREMAALRLEAEQLRNEVCDPNTRLVWGVGGLSAELAFVGEAPGAMEDKKGVPFVGQAGRKLRSELSRHGVEPETVYITNVVKCRPVDERDGRHRNRPPSDAEVRAWLGIFNHEMEIVAPRFIVCLGATNNEAENHLCGGFPLFACLDQTAVLHVNLSVKRLPADSVPPYS